MESTEHEHENVEQKEKLSALTKPAVDQPYLTCTSSY